MVLAADVRDTLMCIPVILVGQCLGNAVVEIFIVREDDMSADIIELGAC